MDKTRVKIDSQFDEDQVQFIQFSNRSIFLEFISEFSANFNVIVKIENSILQLLIHWLMRINKHFKKNLWDIVTAY